MEGDVDSNPEGENTVKLMRSTMISAALAVGLMMGGSLIAQEAAAPAATIDSSAYEADVAKILNNDKFKAAVEHMDSTYDRLLAEFEELVEIPAPPFKEAERAARYKEMFEEAGLTDVEIDEEGNVLGIRKGTASDGNFLVWSAHLDTVFPEGTDTTIEWRGTEAHAPGVGDDTMHLAVNLAYIRALDAASIQTKDDILFVGTVGEEGPGDLRGVRHLFTEGKYKDQIKGFISLDGGNAGRATVGATGSVRYLVTYKAPGGHSFGAFGLVNPAYALADMMTMLSDIDVPTEPKTTHNIGVIAGGTSVNSIPFEVSAEVDMRSNSPEELDKVHARFKVIVEQAAANENARRSTAEGPITLDLKQIGLRPAGFTPEEQAIYQYTKAANVAAGMGFKGDGYSSTDSNIPMSMGIPALTIGAKGVGGRSHSLDEWLDTDKDKTLPNMRATFLVLLANAGMVE
jgi:acetylornithine deacetylase/succinyl-diaminopimelate desuccinylase-like protein